MSKFQPIEFYGKKRPATYQLLPFRFSELDEGRYVLTNLSGEYLVAPKSAVKPFVEHRLDATDPLYKELRARHFLVDDKTNIAPDLLAIKLRTRYERLSDFTGLHIFVVSLRCEHSCPYCQVSRQSEDKSKFDMSESDALAAIDLVLQAPATNLKVEFQGGESLLNFDLIKFIVNEFKTRQSGKNIAYVIATNLALIDEVILDFCREHKILISTSLDGPRELHNKNRPRPGKDSYERAVAGIHLVREHLGRDQVSALMTTTESSLAFGKEIVDEYLAQGFSGIFLRPLSPYGFAIKTKSYLAYNTDRWLDFYRKTLDYIVDLNREGISFREQYAATILTKMFTSTDPGYVDLMSPAGIGIGAVVYNYDGAVYASDEARMLAEMGETKFKIGQLNKDSYKDIFLSPNLLDPLDDSFAFSVPMCNDCAYEPYCGADPVFHFGIYKDYVGRKPESEFCRRNMATFQYLIARMEEDRFVKKLFLSWARHS
jgi:uncharacterized protein